MLRDKKQETANEAILQKSQKYHIGLTHFLFQHYVLFCNSHIQAL